MVARSNRRIDRFRWTALQLDALAACQSFGDLEDTLRELPADLYQTYDRIILKIPTTKRQAALQLLQFLLYSEGNLKIPEAIDVMAVDLTKDYSFDPKNRLRGHRDISGTFFGLIKFVGNPETNESDTVLALAHASVKDYLLSNEIIAPFNKSFDEVTAKVAMVQVCISYFNAIASNFKINTDQKRSHYEISARYPLVRHLVQLEQSNAIFWRPIWLRYFDHEGIHKETFQLLSEFLNDETPGYMIFKLLNKPRTMRQCNLWNVHGPIFFAILANHFDVVKLLIEKSWTIHNRIFKFKHRYSTLLENSTHVLNLFQAGQRLINESLLSIACDRANERIIGLLLDKGANPNECGGEAFSRVCRSGNFELVKRFLSRGAHVNLAYYTGYSPLEAACRSREKKVIKLLLSNGANPNEDRGNTFLWACKNGDIEIVRLLLDRGAVVNQLDHNSPLQAACWTGNLELAELLIERGARMTQGAQRELYSAIWSGSLEVVEFLVHKGADVKSRDSGALSHACKVGNLELARFFLNHSADINDGPLLESACKAIGPPFYREHRGASLKLVLFLLDRGANVNKGIRWTPLECACQVFSLKLVQLLLDRGADVNGGIESSPLECACRPHIWRGSPPRAWSSLEAKRLEVVKLLLYRGADVNGGIRQSPLKCACETGNLELVRLLLDRGADVNVNGTEGCLLVSACYNTNLDLARLLLANGADVNAACGAPLNIACRMANLQLTRLLLEYGADVNASIEEDLKFSFLYDDFCQYERCPPYVHFWNTAGSGSNLIAACCGGSIDIIRLLLDRGVERQTAGRISLYVACWWDNAPMAEVLLGNGTKGSPGYSEELLGACYLHSISTAKLLLDRGADPNGFSGSHLVFASMQGNLEVVELLIRYGADVNMSPYEESSALDIAKACRLQEIAQILCEHGATPRAKSRAYGPIVITGREWTHRLKHWSRLRF